MEFILVLCAAARFRRAWIAIDDCRGPLGVSDPRSMEMNEAMRELMDATETVDPAATFEALDELVRRVDGVRPTMP